MLRPASRVILRGSTLSVRQQSITSRRLLSTAPPQKSRGWKSSAIRWGLAIGAVYYYNSSNLFAEEPAYVRQPSEVEYEPEALPTIDSLAEERRQRSIADTQSLSSESVATPGLSGIAEGATVEPGSVEELEEEAGQQGAFNPETGEINWDCPCLGGMAYGPCGEEFRAAFSCFIYSKEEPKGVDCIEKFKGMQDCFRQYPDVYGEELDEDDNDEGIKLSETANTVSREGETSSVISQDHGNAKKDTGDHSDKAQPALEHQIEASKEVAGNQRVADDKSSKPEESVDSSVPGISNSVTSSNNGARN